jgi:predicted dehydrogenase
MAGGSLLDVGVYGLHFASIFLGSSPERISAVSQVRHDVDIHTSIMLEYKNGAIANVSSAIGLLKPESGFVYGTKGYIRFPCFYYAGEFFVNAGGKEREIIKKYQGNGFEEEIIECCQCIINKKTESDILPLDESIAIMEQMDCVRSQIGLKYPSDSDAKKSERTFCQSF